MSDPADKRVPHLSPLWPPPGDSRAAHKAIPGTRQCAPDCPCWAARRGKAQPTTLLLVHAPSEADLTRALCGGAEGWVTGVEFHSPVTCPECRERQGKPRDLLSPSSRLRLITTEDDR